MMLIGHLRSADVDAPAQETAPGTMLSTQQNEPSPSGAEDDNTPTVLSASGPDSSTLTKAGLATAGAAGIGGAAALAASRTDDAQRLPETENQQPSSVFSGDANTSLGLPQQTQPDELSAGPNVEASPQDATISAQPSSQPTISLSDPSAGDTPMPTERQAPHDVTSLIRELGPADKTLMLGAGAGAAGLGALAATHFGNAKDEVTTDQHVDGVRPLPERPSSAARLQAALSPSTVGSSPLAAPPITASDGAEAPETLSAAPSVIPAQATAGPSTAATGESLPLEARDVPSSDQGNTLGTTAALAGVGAGIGVGAGMLATSSSEHERLSAATLSRYSEDDAIDTPGMHADGATTAQTEAPPAAAQESADSATQETRPTEDLATSRSVEPSQIAITPSEQAAADKLVTECSAASGGPDAQSGAAQEPQLGAANVVAMAGAAGLGAAGASALASRGVDPAASGETDALATSAPSARDNAPAPADAPDTSSAKAGQDSSVAAVEKDQTSATLAGDDDADDKTAVGHDDQSDAREAGTSHATRIAAGLAAVGAGAVGALVARRGKKGQQESAGSPVDGNQDASARTGARSEPQAPSGVAPAVAGVGDRDQHQAATQTSETPASTLR